MINVEKLRPRAKIYKTVDGVKYHIGMIYYNYIVKDYMFERSSSIAPLTNSAVARGLTSNDLITILEKIEELREFHEISVEWDDPVDTITIRGKIIK